MLPVLEEILKAVKEDYNEQLGKKELSAQGAADRRNFCISALVGRMELLDENDEEYKECSFVARSLANGWLVSDIDMLRKMYQTVQRAPEGELRKWGGQILDQFSTIRTDSLIGRFQMVNLADQYLLKLGFNPDFKKIKDEFTEDFHTKTIYPAEYPNDENFAKTSGKANPEEGVSYREVSGQTNKDNDRYDEIKKLKETHARTAEDYIIEEISDSERAAAKRRPFVPNESQQRSEITKSDSQAVREVLGDAVYDEIDEMSRGSLEDRRVKLHHSLGTRQQKKGHEVLEMDFAGSSGQDVMRKHKGHNGYIDYERRTPEQVDEFYGKQALDADGDKFKYIRYKKSEVQFPDNTSAEKMRYSIAGPSPDWFNGYLNMGPYSIENGREYARFLASQFLEKRFEEWLRTGKRKPIDINLSGHSRGAVTAGQAAKLIDEWITKYIETHPGAEDFKEYVNYNLVLKDPVPGFITDLHLGSCNLRGIPNLNVTVFCTMAINAPDFIMPLQHVRGARKLILTTDVHDLDIAKTDNSQKKVLGGNNDGHMESYFDAETGEMHRGSGLNELPDGIYVADEKRNLVRITSYSQVNEIFGTLYDKTDPQRIRSRRIHKMVRDWFLENGLEMSFPDERTRKKEEEKNFYTQKKILQSTNKRLLPVKEEIRKLNELKKQNADKETIMEQNSKLIEACRRYMKDTDLPPAAGDSSYRVNLVADTLSYTMRENNQLDKELSLERGEKKTFALDDKIRAHKDRLEKKPGYLERKAEAETKRLGQEKDILKLIKETAKCCSDTMKELDKTRVGKSNSSSYEKMYKVLEEGAKLGEQTSVNEMSQFLKRFTDLSKSYSSSHNRVIGPRTADGKKRLSQSKIISEYGTSAAKKLQELSEGVGEKSAPIGAKIRSSENEIKYVKERQQELQGAKKQDTVNELKKAVQQAPGL